ncbi:3-hydroxybenzoate 4-monooxygenase [Apiospora arundinis]|uniref:3-hydroxybenzoate 4-monooxygenase n=1 Tax=Apiospora arundinis TaxID=335852 RepID=A0ABR2IHL9_9PEZI
MDPDVENMVDLVVIGGGPTGLLCALLARQLGLSVSLIDENPSTLQAGRADGINARTQQYLEIAGVLTDLQPKGIRCDTSSTFAEGAFQSRQNTWWTTLEHCHYKSFLLVGQSEVEKTLLDQLENHDQKASPIVRFGERATYILENAQGVTVTAVAATGSANDGPNITRARFAIGADGARSMVRQVLGIDFHGTQPEMVWAVLDTFLDTDFPVCPEIISMQLDDQNRVLWVPRERGMSRFYVRLLEGREIIQKAAEETIREHMAPYRVEFLHTEWFSTFEVKERIASSFVSKDGKGRIALAGDAAHAHSINGAQGLNTGIADAFGLIWRIALLCKNEKRGVQPDNSGYRFQSTGSNGNNCLATIEDLMKTYEIERHTVARAAVSVAAQLVRDTRHSAKQYVSSIEKNAAYVTGMGVAYNGIGSPLVVESEQGIWKAGKRCPDFTLTKARYPTCGHKFPEQQRLYSMVSYGRFLVLVLGDRDGQTADYEWGIWHVPDVFVLLPPRDPATKTNTAADIRANNESGSSANLSADSVADYSDTTDLVFESDVVNPDDSFVVVVRPDMYIGYVGDCGGSHKYMDNFCY